MAVQLKGRPWSAVVSDMIEGVVAANGLTGAKADRARAALWLAVEEPAATKDRRPARTGRAAS